MRRYTDWWLGVGRLRPGVSVAKAQEEMKGIGRQLEREYHTGDLDFAGFGVNVVPVLLQVVGRKTPFLLAVLSASVFVLLLIACSNLAQLLLARGAAREHEFALRRALGAGRGRLIRQLLSESILLSAFACIAGVALAFCGVRLLLALAPAGIPRLQEIAIDGPVLVFTALMSVAAAILLGLAPAIQQSRIESDGRASAGRSRARTRDFLVACEFAMGVVLLFTATLLVRSYARVQSVDPGFRTDHLLMARITRSSNTNSTLQDFYPRLLDRMKGLPGVTDAATIQQGFFLDWNPDQVITAEEPSAGPVATASSDQLNGQGVSPGYFRAMNIPLLKGRLLEDGDRNVAVINSEMARRYWPGKDPIGKRFKTGMPASKSPWKTVVGMVANTRRQGKEIAPIPEYYVLGWGRAVDVVVRTESSPIQLGAALRTEVRGLDKSAVVSRISTMEQRLDELLAPRRFETLLLTLFSVVAVILAAIGIYGATYYAVGQRVKEIGIRIALGARPASVVTMLLRQTARVALAGIAAGLVVSLGLSRTVASLLYEIAPADPTTLSVVPAALILVAVCAALIPASRATRIDPIVALRHG